MLSQASNPNEKFKQLGCKSNERMIFGIHGGGNIGLGLMADIISKSTMKYEIVATSNDDFLVNLINGTNRYSLRHKGEGKSASSTLIENVKMVSRNSSDIIQLYKAATIVAICLTPVVISTATKDIAHGLIERYRAGGDPLKILILMNIPQCDQFVRDKIKSEMGNLVEKNSEIDAVLSTIQFIPTVVDRIVTKIDEKEVKSHLENQLLNSSSHDCVDGNQINSQIDMMIASSVKLAEVVKKLNLDVHLFNAEKNYVLYVPKAFSEATYFPNITQINNLEQIEAIKNKYINGPHAILAWMGALLGCKTIAEAIRLTDIRRFIKKMMDEEIRPALMAEFPDLTMEELNKLRKLFIKRCIDSTDDLVTRVGRDPLRKINANGRIRGTIELCKKHGLKTSITKLEQGIAVAILYAVKGIDNTNPGCIKIRDLYLQNNKAYKAVLCYKGESPAGLFQGLDPDSDKSLIGNILSHIEFFEKIYDDREKRRKSKMALVPVIEDYYKQQRVNVYNNLHSTFNVLSYFKYFFPQPNRNLMVVSTAPKLEIINLLEVKKTIKLIKKTNSPDTESTTSSNQLFYKFEGNMNIYRKLSQLGVVLNNHSGHLSYVTNYKPMELNFDLVFVRHGETYGNCGQTTSDAKIDFSLVKSNKKDPQLRIFQGNVDTAINQLTEYGKKQALEVAKQLEDELLKNGWEPDIIFHSPLSRAKDTGTPFVERNKFADRYIQLDDIREMSFGSWDNRRVCDMKSDDQCHSFYKEQNALVKNPGINANGKLQNSENFCEVLIRAYNILQYLNKHYNGKKIIMFSHSMFGAACCILLGKGQQYENGNHLAFDGKRKDGESYIMPNATPCYLSMKTIATCSRKIKSAQ